MEPQSSIAAVIHEIGNLESISVDRVPLPNLEENQVLIRMEYAPINVMDLMSATGHFWNPSAPKILGFEGSGTVVKSGSHPHAQSLIGKRVAALVPLKGNGGSYSEYLITSSFTVVVLKDSVTFQQGASLLINPMTVAVIIEKIKEGNHTSVIFDAAASALAKMVIRWCIFLNITPICLVRRQDQVDLLASLGAQHIFDTSKPGWKEEAKTLTSQLETKIGFDCISGTEAQTLLDLLSEGGTLYLYGNLSGHDASINPLSVIDGDKIIRGVTWASWFFHLSPEKRAQVENEVQDLIGSILKTDFHSEITLDGVKEALKQYSSRKTDSKFLIRLRQP